MPVMSIIACRMLEDELAHVLSEDRALRHLILVDSGECLGLGRKLSAQNRPYLSASLKEIPEMLKGIQSRSSGRFARCLRNKLQSLRSGQSSSCNCNSAQDLIVVVNILKMGLHTDGKLLKEAVYGSIDCVSKFSDRILVFYGLCGNSLGDLETDFQGKGCPLYFLRDETGQRADDCIAVALGGNRQYEKTLSSHPEVGVFFTPMWAANLGEMDRETSMSSRSEGLGGMLKRLGFKKVAGLDTGLHFISQFEVETKINELAKMHNLGVIRLKGSTDMVDKCYKYARDGSAAGISVQALPP